MHRLPVFVALLALGACDEQDLPPRDVAASAWALGRPVPRAVRDPGVTQYGQQVIVAGGIDATGAVSTEVDAYDVAGDAWHTEAALPVAWSDLDLGAVGDTMYALGGLDAAGEVHAEAFRHDPVDQGWVAIAPLPEARAGAGVISTTGHLDVLGGRSATAPLATCLEYNLITNTWSSLPDLPEPRAYPAVMRQTDGTLIVAGGFASVDRSAPRGDVWALPPAGSADRTWKRRTAMPDARGDCGYGVVASQLVCAGGATAAAASPAVDLYDPYLDVWTVGEPLPVARVQTQGAVVGNRLFVPGGAATPDGAPTDAMYLFAPLDTAPR